MLYLALTDKNPPAIPHILQDFGHLQPFHIEGTCLDPEIARTRKVSRAFRSVIPTHFFMWSEIFKYLEPRDLCKLVVTAKGWSRFLNLKPLMYQYFSLEGLSQYHAFEKMISEIPENVPMPPLVIEFSKWYNKVHISQRQKIEALFRSRGYFHYQMVCDFLQMTYDTWREIAAVTNQEIISKIQSVSLTQNRTMSENNLREFFRDLKDVPVLDLSHSASSAHFLNPLRLRDASLPHLKYLKMFRSKLPIHLASLLRAAPHLKDIDLGESKAVDCSDLLHLAVGSCPVLADMNLKGVTVENEGVQAILRAAPHLKKLNLSHCSEVKEGLFDSLQKNALPFIDEVILSKTNITKSDLLVFLEIAPNVKNTDLQFCEKINGGMRRFHKLKTLDSLEVVNLQYSHVHGRFVRALLEAAPNMRVINMTGCKEIKSGAFKRLKPNSLSSLEDMRLGGTGIGPSDFEALLRAAPNVKRIGIEDCPNLQDGVLQGITIKGMEALEYLDLRYLELLMDDFRALIKLAPNIKELKLRGAKETVRSLFENLRKYSLTPLEEIDLSDTDMTLSGLEGLAAIAPHLKKIDLFGCQNMRSQQAPWSPHFQFIELEEINLVQTDVTLREVQYFLKAAPKLKKLTLIWSSDISDRLSKQDLALIPSHIQIQD